MQEKRIEEENEQSMWALDELGEVNHVVSIVVQLFPDAIHLAIFFQNSGSA